MFKQMNFEKLIMNSSSVICEMYYNVNCTHASGFNSFKVRKVPKKPKPELQFFSLLTIKKLLIKESVVWRSPSQAISIRWKHWYERFCWNLALFYVHEDKNPRQFLACSNKFFKSYKQLKSNDFFFLTWISR